MKVILKKSVEVSEEHEIEFPVYINSGDIYDEGGWYESRYRITTLPEHFKNGKESTVGFCIDVVTERGGPGNKTEFEFSRTIQRDISEFFRASGFTYYYTSSKDVYDGYVKRLQENLNVMKSDAYER